MHHVWTSAPTKVTTGRMRSEEIKKRMRSEATFINSKESNAKVKQGWFQKRGYHEERSFTIYKDYRNETAEMNQTEGCTKSRELPQKAAGCDASQEFLLVPVLC
jgi:hypothetical protein